MRKLRDSLVKKYKLKSDVDVDVDEKASSLAWIVRRGLLSFAVAEAVKHLHATPPPNVQLPPTSTYARSHLNSTRCGSLRFGFGSGSVSVSVLCSLRCCVASVRFG